MKKEYPTVGTVPKSNRKIVERDEINTSNTKIHKSSPLLKQSVKTLLNLYNSSI